MTWSPDKMRSKKAVPASCAQLTCRFAKEAAQNKKEMLADIDFIDVAVRQETMNNAPGQPIQVQLGVVPCYACASVVGTNWFAAVDLMLHTRAKLCFHCVAEALTVHKTQALFGPQSWCLDAARCTPTRPLTNTRAVYRGSEVDQTRSPWMPGRRVCARPGA